MKTPFNKIVLLIILISFSCANEKNPDIKFHKSQDESRKNTPFSKVTQVGNLYF